MRGEHRFVRSGSNEVSWLKKAGTCSRDTWYDRCYQEGRKVYVAGWS